jgi:sulfur-oxidizing protein SoxZ
MESNIKMRAKMLGETMLGEKASHNSSLGNITEVKVIISHPIETGRKKDEFGVLIPAHFIQLVTATLNGTPVLEMQWGTGIAKNPYLTFYLSHAKLGDKVAVTWLDNLGNTGSGEIFVTK